MKTIAQDVVERVRATYPQVLDSVKSHLGTNALPSSADRQLGRIAADPAATELLNRGYGVGIADAARRQE